MTGTADQHSVKKKWSDISFMSTGVKKITYHWLYDQWCPLVDMKVVGHTQLSVPNDNPVLTTTIHTS